jgi:carboxyl-terminal processing protease
MHDLKNFLSNLLRIARVTTRLDLLFAKGDSSKEAVHAALKEALKQLDDPYTRFMNPQEFQVFQSDTAEELTKTLTVVEPIENSPALQAGIQAGGNILQINGRSTEGMSVETAAGQICGQAGTQVTKKFNFLRQYLLNHP